MLNIRRELRSSGLSGTVNFSITAEEIEQALNGMHPLARLSLVSKVVSKTDDSDVKDIAQFSDEGVKLLVTLSKISDKLNTWVGLVGGKSA